MVRKFLVCFLIALLSACAVSLDTHTCLVDAERVGDKDNTYQVTTAGHFPHQETDEVLNLFEDEWSNSFGSEDIAIWAVNNLCVVWEPYPWAPEPLFGPGLPPSQDGRPQLVAGELIAPPVLRVYIGGSENRSIAETSLPHEMTHLMLLYTTGNGDPDHEQDQFSGWTENHNALIERVQNRMADQLSEAK